MIITWSTALFLATVGLFLLPLLPALFEVFWPTDVAPLKVVQDYDNNPMHLDYGFRKYIATHDADIKNTDNTTGTLSDGTPFNRIGEKNRLELDAARHTKLILSQHPLDLPGGKSFEAEVYSEQTIITGNHSFFRAILANETLSFGDYSTVLRWAHSEGAMEVGYGSVLYGRATSNQQIRLGIDCYFERIHAPVILCGKEPAESSPPLAARMLLEEIKHVKSKAGRRRLLEGDLDFPANHVFDGDIVAGSTATVGDNAHIKGSLKSNALNDIVHYLHTTGALAGNPAGRARCELGNQVQLDGALISTHDLYIGKHCRILGPVVAENLLVIRTGTVIGTPDHPTTVTAPEIIIESGCIIFGSLWATKQGHIQSMVQEEEIAA